MLSLQSERFCCSTEHRKVLGYFGACFAGTLVVFLNLRTARCDPFLASDLANAFGQLDSFLIPTVTRTAWVDCSMAILMHGLPHILHNIALSPSFLWGVGLADEALMSLPAPPAYCAAQRAAHFLRSPATSDANCCLPTMWQHRNEEIMAVGAYHKDTYNTFTSLLALLRGSGHLNVMNCSVAPIRVTYMKASLRTKHLHKVISF